MTKRIKNNSIKKKNSLLLILSLIFIIISIIFITAKAINLNNKITSNTSAAVNKKPKLIISGNPAQPGEFPFMVAIYDKNEFDKKSSIGFVDDLADSIRLKVSFYCGGSLIGDQWVLTAAHCVYNTEKKEITKKNPSDIGIAVGFTNLAESISKDQLNGRFINVSQIVEYNNFGYYYSHNLYFDDVALLKLAKKVKQPTVSISDDFPITLPGKEITAIGWGKNNTFFLTGASDALNKTTMKINKLPISDNPTLIKFYHSYIYTSAENPSSVCEGDSGGPGLSWSKNKLVQIGVISGGVTKKCADSVFTNVTKLTKWIYKITGIKTYQGTFNGNSLN